MRKIFSLCIVLALLGAGCSAGEQDRVGDGSGARAETDSRTGSTGAVADANEPVVPDTVGTVANKRAAGSGVPTERATAEPDSQDQDDSRQIANDDDMLGRLDALPTPSSAWDNLDQSEAEVIAWLEEIEDWFVEVVTVSDGAPFTEEVKRAITDRLQQLFAEEAAAELADAYIDYDPETGAYFTNATDYNLGLDRSNDYLLTVQKDDDRTVILTLAHRQPDKIVHRSVFLKERERSVIAQFVTSVL